MGDFVVLYKDGVVSPPLHPVDATGWKSLGWTASEQEVEVQNEPPTIPLEIVPPAGFVAPPVSAESKVEAKKPGSRKV
jgi:hypothetical protein